MLSFFFVSLKRKRSYVPKENKRKNEDFEKIKVKFYFIRDIFIKIRDWLHSRESVCCNAAEMRCELRKKVACAAGLYR